jgi:hypothetical protein
VSGSVKSRSEGGLAWFSRLHLFRVYQIVSGTGTLACGWLVSRSQIPEMRKQGGTFECV